MIGAEVLFEALFSPGALYRWLLQAWQCAEAAHPISRTLAFWKCKINWNQFI